MLQRREAWLVGWMGANVFSRTLRYLFVYPVLHWRATASAERDLVSTLRTFPQSAIFIPWADFYTILAILRLSRRGLFKERIVVIRLIAVWEDWGFLRQARGRTRKHLAALLSGDAANDIRVSAETEKYAAELEATIGHTVTVSPIPLSFEPEHFGGRSTVGAADGKPVAERMVKVGFLGEARAGKGYFDVLRLVRSVSDWGNAKVQFFIQPMSSGNSEYCSEYENELAVCPNVKILNAYLYESEYFALIQDMDIIVLPYLQEAYEWRGSAVLFEAAQMGKPVIGRNGTAFGSTVTIFDLGRTFVTNADFSHQLKKLIDQLSTPDGFESASERGRAFAEAGKASLLNLLVTCPSPPYRSGPIC